MEIDILLTDFVGNMRLRDGDVFGGNDEWSRAGTEASRERFKRTANECELTLIAGKRRPEEVDDSYGETPVPPVVFQYY